MRIDLGALDHAASDLKVLFDEFSSASNQGDEVAEVAGAHQIRDAMGTFTGNWRRHREGMMSLLEAGAQMARDGHTTYTDTDQALADALNGEAG